MLDFVDRWHDDPEVGGFIFPRSILDLGGQHLPDGRMVLPGDLDGNARPFPGRAAKLMPSSTPTGPCR